MKNIRQGITLTEALSAIAVASIGLFGVMAIIPLASLQTKRGLDTDEMVVVGNSAIELVKIYQMTDPLTWRELNGAGGFKDLDYHEVPYLDSNHTAGFCYVIDPMMLESNRTVNVLDDFPFVAGGSTITGGTSFEPAKRINISNALVNSFESAKTIFQANDDLVLDEITNKLELPPQKFDFDLPGGNPLRRSANREVTWSVMLNSEAYGSDVYRMYVMVFRKRSFVFDEDGDGTGEGEQTWEVNFVGSGAGGGEIVVSNSTGIRKLDDGIFAGDWMLLTDNLPSQNSLRQGTGDADDYVIPNLAMLQAIEGNRSPPTTISGADAEAYFIRPIQPYNWYRVNRVGSANTQRLSLTGPDFNSSPVFEFVTIGAIRAYLNDSSISYNDLTSSIVRFDRQVYGTVFSNLEAVYEKTIRLENQSIWR